MAWGRIKTNSVSPADMHVKSNTWTGSGHTTKPYTSITTDWGPDKVMSEAMDRVTWVLRAVQAISSNAAKIPMVLRKDDADVGPLAKNPALMKVLMSRANVGETAFSFRYRLSAQILLSSNGAFIEVGRDRSGRVTSLTLLPPQYVTPVPHPKTFVSKYVFDMPVMVNGDFKPIHKELKPENVVWIRQPHPFDPYKSKTCLDAVGLAVETDWYAKLYNRNFLLNDGRPGGLVVIKGEATPEDREELKARFRGNLGNAGRISVITSETGADFVDTAITPRDAQYSDTRKITKDEILIAFGVPESVLGNAAGRTFDNADIERLVFWQETMIPHLKLVCNELEVLDENESTFVGVNLDSVDVLQRADMKRKEFLLREFDGGLIDTDEYREDTGREATGTPQGKVLFRMNTKLPFTTTDGSKLPKDTHGAINDPLPKPPKVTENQNNEGRPQAPNAATPTPDKEPTAADEANDTKPKPLASQPKKPKSDGAPTVDFNEMLTKVDGPEFDYDSFKESTLNDYERWQMVMDASLKRFYERQARVVGEKMTGQKMRRLISKRSKILEELGPVSGPNATPALSLQAAVDNVYDQEAWDRQLKEDLEPVLRGIFKEFGEAVAEGFDEHDSTVTSMIEQQIKRAQKINAQTRERISTAIVAGVMVDSDTDAIAKQLIPIFTDPNVREVSALEVPSAAMGAKFVAAGQLGLSKKTWISVNGSSASESKGINETFDTKKFKGQYPGDPFSHFCAKDLSTVALTVDQ